MEITLFVPLYEFLGESVLERGSSTKVTPVAPTRTMTSTANNAAEAPLRFEPGVLKFALVAKLPRSTRERIQPIRLESTPRRTHIRFAAERGEELLDKFRKISKTVARTG